MKNGIPTIYWVFRWIWSGLQVSIVVLLAIAFVLWAASDSGIQFFESWLSWIQNVRQSLSRAIPYPWD